MNELFRPQNGFYPVGICLDDQLQIFLYTNGFDADGQFVDKKLESFVKEKNGQKFFENDVFAYRSYSKKYEGCPFFIHKPSGIEICWAPAPANGYVLSNQLLGHDFLDILEECENSIE